MFRNMRERGGMAAKAGLLCAATILFALSSCPAVEENRGSRYSPSLVHIDDNTGKMTISAENYVPGSWILWQRGDGLFRYTLLGYSDRQDDGSYALEWRLERYDKETDGFVLVDVSLGGHWVTDGDELVYEKFVRYPESTGFGYEKHYNDKVVIKGKEYDVVVIEAYNSLDDKIYLKTVCTGQIPYPGPAINVVYYRSGVADEVSHIVDFHVPQEPR